MDRGVWRCNLFLINVTKTKRNGNLVMRDRWETARELVENFWKIYEASVEYHWHALPINRLAYAAYGNITNIAHCLFFPWAKIFTKTNDANHFSRTLQFFLLSIDEPSDKTDTQLLLTHQWNIQTWLNLKPHEIYYLFICIYLFYYRNA